MCGYCNTESRFDNLKRHTLVHGKDLPLKFTPIENKESVKSFFVSKSQATNNNQKELDSETQNDDAQLAIFDESNVIGDCSDERGIVADGSDHDEADSVVLGDNTDDSSEKIGLKGDRGTNVEKYSIKRRLENDPSCSSSTKSRKVEMTQEHFDFDKKFEDLGEMLISKVNERLQAVEKLLSEKNTEVVMTEEENNNKIEDLKKVEALMNSKDVEGAEACLHDLSFGKVGETDEEITFYCKICFENSPPLLSNSNVPGCFTLDLAAYSEQKFLKPEQQPRVLRSLKNNIKRHITEYQAHAHKVEEKLRRDKSQLSKESRSKKIGLNVFRIRYAGIKQHQPRTAFEENILTA